MEKRTRNESTRENISSDDDDFSPRNFSKVQQKQQTFYIHEKALLKTWNFSQNNIKKLFDKYFGKITKFLIKNSHGI
jgi:hypothetical protein